MTRDAPHAASDRADAIAQAYSEMAKPPLTQELIGRLQAALDAAFEADNGYDPSSLDRLNAVLDGFETELRSIVGPRIASIDDASGSVTMKHRSEAGQPLRSYGGQ